MGSGLELIHFKLAEPDWAWKCLPQSTDWQSVGVSVKVIGGRIKELDIC